VEGGNFSNFDSLKSTETLPLQRVAQHLAAISAISTR